MRECIAKAGHISIGVTKFRRFMAYSVEEHFNGTELKLPSLAHPVTGKALQGELL